MGWGTSALSPLAQVRAAQGCAQTWLLTRHKTPSPWVLPSPEQPERTHGEGGGLAGTGVRGHLGAPCLKGDSPVGKEKRRVLISKQAI